MRLIKLALICLAVCLTGCVTGVRYQDMSASIATLKPDQGRIYFVREDTMLGGAVQPDISLDKVVVGESKPGGFFYVDTVPGKHIVSTATEVENHVTFMLDAGETKYIRTLINMGFMVGHVTPIVISPEEGMEYLQQSKYIGKIGVPGLPNQPAVAAADAPTPQPVYAETTPVADYSSPAPAQSTRVESAQMAAPQPQIVEPKVVEPKVVEPKIVNVNYQVPQVASTTKSAHYSQASVLGSVAVASDNGKVAFKLGVSSNTVEKMGKNRGCESKQGASLITENGPAEVYMMSCEDGSAYLARCELRQCVAM
jgi:hypothetical protein